MSAENLSSADNLSGSTARTMTTDDPAKIRKHSITLHGHATSFSLEDAFYQLIVIIARERQQSLASLIAQIDDQRERQSNLSSSLRLYALEWAMNRNWNPSEQ